MTNDRSALDVAHGLDVDFIHALPYPNWSALMRLMARVAERSYRRGFQQGATIALNRAQDLPLDLSLWRYGAPLDISPWADAPRAETSVHRLLAENPSLGAASTAADISGRSGPVIFAWPERNPA